MREVRCSERHRRSCREMRLVSPEGSNCLPEEPYLVLLSCAAETIMLGLSGYQSKHLCGHLDVEIIETIGRQAESFGFSVVH
jgi:predicted amino acid dehydrogenase